MDIPKDMLPGEGILNYILRTQKDVYYVSITPEEMLKKLKKRFKIK